MFVFYILYIVFLFILSCVGGEGGINTIILK